MDPATIALLTALVSGGLAGFGGKKEKFGSTYNKGQRSAIDDLLQNIKGQGGVPDVRQDQNYQTGQDWLQSMFNDPQFFDKFEAPLQRQYQEQTVPDLANRFASMGSGGSLGSTAFRNQLAREGSNLNTNIAALRGGMQQQAIPQLSQYAQQPFNNMIQMLNQALQPTNNQYQPATQGFFGPIAASGAGAASQGFGQQLGQNMASGFGYQSPNNSGNGIMGAMGATNGGRFAGQSPLTM